MNKSSTNQKQATMKRIIIRLIPLILSALLGILLLFVFTIHCENWLGMFSKLCEESRFIASFKIILLGLFIFIMLWCFRTLDTKEQLDKSEEQINQNNYFQGLDNLVSNESLKVEIGVQQLLELSKVTEKYKDGIKFAFIERLKSPLKKKEGKVIYFFYAQYIVNWLSENYHSTELDLDGCNFDYQEFKIKTNFNIFRNEENSLERLSFVGADLSGTDLSGTDLKGANLSGANLSRANLSGANLSGADFSGADFSGTDLSGANLANAVFVKNQYLPGSDFERLGYKLEIIVRDNTNFYRLVKENS